MVTAAGAGGQPDVRAAWGKAANGTVPHPLVCHAVDTAAVAEQLLDVLTGPQCREEVRSGLAPLGDPVAWIAVLCGLHDLGKFSPTFQALRDDLAVELLGESAAADIRLLSQFKQLGRTDTPHGVLTAVHLERMLRGWGAELWVARRLAAVLGGHHGYFPDAESLSQAEAGRNHHGGPRWASWRDGLVTELVRLWKLPAPASLAWGDVRLGVGAAVGLAGLASVSDWIASDPANFPYAGAGVTLETYVEQARERAARAVRRLGWSPWSPPVDTGFSALFPRVITGPRPVQHTVQRLLEQCPELGVLVIEAPTGEGKTKAALQSAAVLVGRQKLAGMYVGMPTRATSNHVLAEVSDFLDDHAADLRVRLLHSSAGDHLAAESLRTQPGAGALCPEEVGRDEPGNGSVRAREWFTRKRGLLAPVAVGTVDQALKAGIRSGHVFVALTGLSGKVLILDEVHAYETYMSTLLDRLLWWAGRLGIPVVLLSATLPSNRRQELVRSWCAGAGRLTPSEIPTVPASPVYPRVTWSDGARHGVVGAGVSQLNAERRVRLCRVDDDELVAWLLEHIHFGGCAAAIHNLVRRAEATRDRLREAITRLPQGQQPELIFLTGRVPSARRHAVEERLRRGFGPEASARPLRAVVVGTQVLEQSLDLDFDVMVSDLAPIDSLLQRMGRIHRHQRARPDCLREPVLGVAGVTDTALGPTFPPYTTSVYQRMLLLRTWALLREAREVRSPEQVPGLVDAVYGPGEAVACPPGWQEQWATAAAQLERARKNERYDASEVYVPRLWDDQDLGELTTRATSARRTRKERGRR